MRDPSVLVVVGMLGSNEVALESFCQCVGLSCPFSPLFFFSLSLYLYLSLSLSIDRFYGTIRDKMVKDSEPHVNGFQHVGVWGFRGFGFRVWGLGCLSFSGFLPLRFLVVSPKP